MMHNMIEKLTKCAEMELEEGVKNVDTKEMGDVVDIIKVLAEAMYYRTLVVAMEDSEYGEDYDEYGPVEDGRRGYRGQPRSKSSGRYMSKGDGRRSNRGRRGYEEMGDYEMTPEMYRMYSPEYYRDMDRMDGKMYYSGGSSSGGNSSSGNSSSGNMSSQGGSMGGSQGGSRGYSDGGQQTSRTENARRGYVEAKEMHKGNSAEDKETKRKELDKWMTEFSSDVKQMVGEMSPEEKTVLKAKLNSLHSSI